MCNGQNIWAVGPGVWCCNHTNKALDQGVYFDGLECVGLGLEVLCFGLTDWALGLESGVSASKTRLWAGSLVLSLADWVLGPGWLFCVVALQIWAWVWESGFMASQTRPGVRSLMLWPQRPGPGLIICARALESG